MTLVLGSIRTWHNSHSGCKCLRSRPNLMWPFFLPEAETALLLLYTAELSVGCLCTPLWLFFSLFTSVWCCLRNFSIFLEQLFTNYNTHTQLEVCLMTRLSKRTGNKWVFIKRYITSSQLNPALKQTSPRVASRAILDEIVSAQPF